MEVAMTKKILSWMAGTAVLMTVSAFSSLAAGWISSNSGEWMYQNADGSTIRNSWFKVMKDSNTYWYYAGENGAIKTDGWQTINGAQYYFDGNGVMQVGWVDEDRYYCDKVSGARKTGWQKLPLPDGMEMDLNRQSADGTYWFYLNPRNGLKYAAENTEAVVRNIDGVSYGFYQNGVMVSGWAKTEDASPEIAGYVYFAEKNDGKIKMGQRLQRSWYAVEGPLREDGNQDNSLSTGEVEWFYFGSNGHPVAGGDNRVRRVEKINGSRYLFNERGNPVYGIQLGKVGNDGAVAYYYCGTSKQDCSVRTGKIAVMQSDGEKITAYFDSTGKGYTGINGDTVYLNGRIQTADSDLGYAKITINGKNYVINASGRVVKNRKNSRDRNGTRWSSNAQGILTLDEGLETVEPVNPLLNDEE